MNEIIVPFHDRPRRGARSARVGWIVAANGCHLWQGACSSGGYGTVQVDGRTQHVHRVRYEQEVGPIPEGMPLDHFACDAGPEGCCNPAHVRPVTNRENILRGRDFHAAKTHCPRGHPYRGDNLRVDPRTGKRVCRTCQREAQRACRKRRRKVAT